jgi:hypothetical protein
MVRKNFLSWNMHTCIWTSFCKNQIEILCSFFQIFLLGLLEQPIRSIISKTAWKFVHLFVFYDLLKIKNAIFFKLWLLVKVTIASKDFTLFIHLLDPIDMEKFQDDWWFTYVTLSSSVMPLTLLHHTFWSDLINSTSQQVFLYQNNAKKKCTQVRTICWLQKK